jgi:hypothetical protein
LEILYYQLLLENEQLKLELKQKSLENKQMKEELEEQLLENEYLRKEQQLNKIIFNNTINLIQSLPFNSSYKRPLLFWFIKDLSMQEAMDCYQISQRTYQKLLDEENPELIAKKYAIGVKKQRITSEQKEEISRVLDDTLPKQSGRDYKYQEITDKKLYNIYQGEVINGNPISKIFFIYLIVAKEKIKHSKFRKFCPFYKELESGNQMKYLLKHKQLISIQKREYQKQKQKIRNETTPSIVLITQDFTQIQFKERFV